tara:strand:- start:757 stop:1926 length:1170 start_codon:yes stop_codon:yes gene_type:complete
MSLKNIKALTYNNKNIYIIISGYLIFIFTLLSIYDFNFSLFVQLAENTNLSKLPSNFLKSSGAGYDGQYYFRLSHNPLNINPEYIGINLDNPSYRYSRIGYPLIIWFFTLGSLQLIVPASIIINLISIFLVFLIAFKIFEIFNLEKNNLFIIILLPGYLFCISRNLPELIEVLLILSTLFFYLKNKNTFFIFSSILLILVRETSIIFCLSLLIYNYIENKKLSKSFYLITPIIFYFLWQITIFIMFRDISVNSGFKLHFEMPLLGAYKMLNQTIFFEENILKKITFLIEYLYIYLTIILAIFFIYNYKINNLFKIAFILYAIYFLCLNPVVLSSDWAFMRVFLELNVFSFFIIFSQKNNLTNYYKFFSLFIWIFIFVRIITDEYIKYYI